MLKTKYYYHYYYYYDYSEKSLGVIIIIIIIIIVIINYVCDYCSVLSAKEVMPQMAKLRSSVCVCEIKIDVRLGEKKPYLIVGQVVFVKTKMLKTKYYYHYYYYDYSGKTTCCVL